MDRDTQVFALRNRVFIRERVSIMNATILLIATLTAVLLWIAYRLDQLPTFWRRLAVVFLASWLGYGAVRFADMRAVSDAVQTGLAIALALAGVGGAFFLVQPLAWGIDDYLAERDARNAEVTP